MKSHVLALALALGAGCTVTVGARPRYLPGSVLGSFDEVVSRAAKLGDAALLADVTALSERPEPQQASPALEQLVACAWARVEVRPLAQGPGAFDVEKNWRKRSERCLEICGRATAAPATAEDGALVARLQAGCESELRAATDALHAHVLGSAVEELRKLEAKAAPTVPEVLNGLGLVRTVLRQATGESALKTEVQSGLQRAEAKYAPILEADRRLSEDPRFQELLQRGSELDRRISSLLVQSRTGGRVPRSPEAARLIQQLEAEREAIREEKIALQKKYRGE